MLFGLYFWLYERARALFEDSPSLTVRSFLVNACTGGFTSMLAWTASYPFDSLKSRMQASLAPLQPVGALRLHARALYADGASP